MKKLGTQFFKELAVEAEGSARKSSHCNLHKFFDEKVQRLLISLTKGSYVESHFHNQPHQW